MSDELAAGIVMWGLLCVYIFLPLCVLTFISENTKWGRKAMKWIMKKLDVPTDYED